MTPFAPDLASMPALRSRFADLTDGWRYWEMRRPLYNAVLLAVVAIHFIADWPASRTFLESDTLFGFFILAVLANLAYCAAYLVDLFVDPSGLRAPWARKRWVVVLIGTAFAAVLAHFATTAMLTGSE